MRRLLLCAWAGERFPSSRPLGCGCGLRLLLESESSIHINQLREKDARIVHAEILTLRIPGIRWQKGYDRHLPVRHLFQWRLHRGLRNGGSAGIIGRHLATAPAPSTSPSLSVATARDGHSATNPESVRRMQRNESPHVKQSTGAEQRLEAVAGRVKLRCQISS